MAQSNTLRQVILDTETTGMNMGSGAHYEGHKIIEIGAVEVINRRLTGNHFHVYIQPERLVDPEAFAIHGISDDFLSDKPRFIDIADDFLHFVSGAELIIHNAPFDVGFINYEYELSKQEKTLEQFCKITDSLLLARKLYPGKRNSLDALCDRLHIDNSRRVLHGALLDAEILADVYLIMTGGQRRLSFADEPSQTTRAQVSASLSRKQSSPLKVIMATAEEMQAHQLWIEASEKKSGKIRWPQ